MLADIHDRLPYENTIYFGDTARVPYGPRDLAEVRYFAFEEPTLSELFLEAVAR